MALVIVLALMTLVIILVLAVISTSRDHAQRESLVANGLEADALAQMPADIVLTQLQRATTQALTKEGERVLWTSQPGMIRTFGTLIPPGKERPPARMHYRLYSAPVMNSPSFDATAEATALDEWAAQPAGFTDLNEPVMSTRSGAAERIYPIADPAKLGAMDGYALRATAPSTNNAAHRR